MILILWVFEYAKPSAAVDEALFYASISGCVCGILALLCLLIKSDSEVQVQHQLQEIDFESEFEADESRDRRPTRWLEFYENIQKARLAFASLMVLPAVKSFKTNDETKDECAVCLEEFKAGELIQPFPCKHEFHASCINSWLHAGNITCPVCRFSLKDLLKDQGSLSRNY